MGTYNVTTNTKPEKGINYTIIADSSSDWPSVGNDVYFYDLATKLVYYKNSSGDVISIFEEGGGGTDANAVHVNAAGEINGITAKASPTASDLLIIEDVADSNNKKKIAKPNCSTIGLSFTKHWFGDYSDFTNKINNF